MSLLVPCVGERYLLDAIRNSVGNSLHARLFKINHDPVDADTLTTYEGIESDYPGYAPRVISNWLPPATNTTTDETFMVADGVTFKYTSDPAGGIPDNPQFAFGYFVTLGLGTSATLVWAEKFGSAIAMATNADTFDIQPRLTLD